MRLFLLVFMLAFSAPVSAQTVTYFLNLSKEPWYLRTLSHEASAVFSSGTHRWSQGPCFPLSFVPDLRLRIDAGMTAKLVLQPQEGTSQAILFELLDHTLSNPHLVRLLVVGVGTGQPGQPPEQKCQLWLPSFLPAPLAGSLKMLGPWVEEDTFVVIADNYEQPSGEPPPGPCFQAAVLEAMEVGLGYWNRSPALSGPFNYFYSDLKVGPYTQP